MNFSLSGLLAGFIFGAFGIYFIKRAKRDGNFFFLFIGIALIIYPYFIENVYALWGIGPVLMFLGFREGRAV